MNLSIDETVVQPETIYIDTSAFYALIDRSDRYHEQAKDLWPSLLESHISLMTSNYVVSETINLLQHRLGFEAANLWNKAMLSAVEVNWVDQATHQLGYELWMTLGRRHSTLVDCISYLTMNRHQVEKAFCFKTSYAEQGYTLLPPNSETVHSL